MISIVLITLIYVTIAFGSVSVIRQYIKSRPPGWQTVFDHLIENLLTMTLFAIVYSSSIIIMGVTISPLNDILGYALSGFNFWLAYQMYQYLMFVVVLRYLLIYHSR